MRGLCVVPLRWAAASCLFACLLATCALAAAQGGSATPATSVLEVRLNAQPPVVVLAAERDGQLHLSATAVQVLGLRPPTAAPAFFDGTQPFYRLAALGLTLLRYDAKEGRADLSAPPGAFAPSAQSLQVEPIDVTPGSPAAFLNYDLVLNTGPKPVSADGLFEVVGSSRYGSLSHAFVQRGFAGDSGRRTGGERLATTYRYDWVNQPATLEVGDATARPGAFGLPLRFGGAALYSNYGLRPGFITQPLPRFAGEAAVPSTVDVFINGQLRSSAEVPPGPFTLNQVPVITGAGQARLVIRDALGREQLVDATFYSAGRLLRPGLSEYAFAAGSLRQPSAGEPEYGHGYLSALWRQGVSERLTLEGRIEAEAGVTRAAGAAATFAAPLGEAEIAVAASQSGGDLRWLTALGYLYQSPQRSLALRWEQAQDGFRLAGLADARLATRRLVTASASQQLVPGLSLNLGWIEQQRGDRSATRSTNVDLIWGLRNGMTLLLTAGRLSSGARDSESLRLLLNVPLEPQQFAVFTAEGGSLRQRSATLQRTLPLDEGVGYRFFGSDGSNGGRAEAALLGQTRSLRLSAEASVAQDQPTFTRLGARGSLGTVGGSVFAARSIDDSFALVQVADLPGVPVLLNNQAAGQTDPQGRLVLPRVTALVPQQVAVDIDQLPADVAVLDERASFVAPPRSAVVARIDIRRVASALLRLQLADGSAVPSGVAVRAQPAQDAEASRVGPRGEVFLRARPGPQRLQVDVPGGCSIDFTLPAALPSGAFHEIGPLRCQPARR